MLRSQPVSTWLIISVLAGLKSWSELKVKPLMPSVSFSVCACFTHTNPRYHPSIPHPWSSRRLPRSLSSLTHYANVVLVLTHSLCSLFAWLSRQRAMPLYQLLHASAVCFHAPTSYADVSLPILCGVTKSSFWHFVLFKLLQERLILRQPAKLCSSTEVQI